MKKYLATACGLALTLAMSVAPARADEWNKKTTLKIDQPIQITDTVLQPGQYVLRLLDSSYDRHVVQIYNKDENHMLGMVMAIPAYRMTVTSEPQFTFWETPSGTARAMRTWYYPGDNVGQEFPYPKKLTPVETAAVSAAPPAPSPVVPAPTPAPAAITDSTAASTPTTPEPTPATEPTPVTEPTATTDSMTKDDVVPEPVPVQDQTPAATPTQDSTTDSAPAALPKTASPYPLIGFVGLSSLAAYGLLRAKKQSA
jgi:hypothetical protein